MAFLKRIVVAFSFCFVFLTATAYGQPKYTEDQVKAAFLYNFLSFVEWPATSLHNEISLCLLGDDPIGEYLNGFQGDKVGSRTIVIKKTNSLQAAEKCHAVFIGESEKERAREILNRLRKLPVLTVSDASGFAEAGGMIEFITERSKVRFKINLEAAQKAGLVISSKLIRVSEIAGEK